MLDPAVVSEVKVVDDYTITLVLKSPFPNMLYNLSTSFSGIMSKAAYEKYGAEYGTKYAVGTGPFMFKEWVPNDHILLVKNPDYNWAPSWTKYTGAAKLDSILFRFMPESATRMIELQAGNVHIMLDPPPAREVETLKKDANLKVLEQSAAVIMFIGFNLKDPLFKDIKTRKAVGHAIDRKLIVDTIYQGSGKATTLYLATELGGNTGVDAVSPAFDKAKAQALLAEAGWKLGTDGVLAADNVPGVAKGAKFEVNYLTYQDDAFKRLAEVTQKMLADVGIKANTQLADNPTYGAALKANTFQMILRQYSWDNNDILEWFHHSKNLPNPNYIGVNDKKFDDMLDEANFKTATFEERDVKYQAIQKYLIDTWYPWAPIRQGTTTIIWRASLKDFTPIPLRGASSTYVWLPVDIP
jgi:peptide/nickel transport system substrate-binding protein